MTLPPTACAILQSWHRSASCARAPMHGIAAVAGGNSFVIESRPIRHSAVPGILDPIGLRGYCPLVQQSRPLRTAMGQSRRLSHVRAEAAELRRLYADLGCIYRREAA